MMNVQLKVVIFRIESNSLCILMPDNKLPSENLSETISLDEQVEKMFQKNFGFPLGKNYGEQLYTFSNNKNGITVAYYILLSECDKENAFTQNWKKTSSKHTEDLEIITYAIQRLRWKIEYTNVIYSLLPKTFTLSELQKTYEIILGKKLDKRNFRKKILSLKFLKTNGEKRVINTRPALLYTFTKRTPQLVKVFS